MVKQSALENRLLSRLPSADYHMIEEALKPIDCPVGTIIAEPNQPIPFALFLEKGIASVVVESPEGQRAEGGIIGREGFVTPALILGMGQSPHLIQMQIGGAGHRLEQAALFEAIGSSETLRDTLLRFAHAMGVQAAFTLLSNAVHQINERLARWLLMCHDRLESDDIQLTHEFMSLMLAVRRPSVTTALHALEGNGFIELDRGYVLIRNRAALEEFAGDAYGKPEAEYLRLLGPIK